METERKLDVLADIARALNQSGVTWAVGGSLLLYFKGKTGVFRDIDLMVCETDVEKLKQAMLPLGAPAPSDPNAQYRTHEILLRIHNRRRGCGRDGGVRHLGKRTGTRLRAEAGAGGGAYPCTRRRYPAAISGGLAQILRMDGPDIQGGDDRRKKQCGESGAAAPSGSAPDGAALRQTPDRAQRGCKSGPGIVQ